MTTSVLNHNPQLRSRVEQCLRDGWSLRAIETEIGISRMTVSRYSNGTRRESPRVTTMSRPDLAAARRRLDSAFDHFEYYGDRASYDVWRDAQIAYESLRGPRYAN